MYLYNLQPYFCCILPIFMTFSIINLINNASGTISSSLFNDLYIISYINIQFFENISINVVQNNYYLLIYIYVYYLDLVVVVFVTT